MSANQQQQHEELQKAIADLDTALNQEMTEITTRLDSMQRKIDEGGAPVDLREDIAAIRRVTEKVRGLVEAPAAPSAESTSAGESSSSDATADNPPPPGSAAPVSDPPGQERLPGGVDDNP